MMHGGESTVFAQFGRLHRAGPTDPVEVVALQIHDHHVLGTILGALAKLTTQTAILRRRLPARARALDGLGEHPVALDAKEPLRGKTQHLPRTQEGTRGVRGRRVPGLDTTSNPPYVAQVALPRGDRTKPPQPGSRRRRERG